MNIRSVDLNLFRVFLSVYATRSTTTAATKLGMTQSAVSNSLRRLRETFSDPLFVRSPDGMSPTPLAERLIGPIEQGLLRVTRSLEEATPFDPTQSNRLFRIAMNDIGQMVFLPMILKRASEVAPDVRFEAIDMPVDIARHELLQGRMDLAIGSWIHMGPRFKDQLLFEESFVVLLRKGHPIQPGQLDLAAASSASYISYRPNGTTDDALHQTISRAGQRAGGKIVLTATNALGLASTIATSDLLMITPRKMASAMLALRPDLRTEPLPYSMRPVQILQQWHERFDLDVGNRWLRKLISDLVVKSNKKNIQSIEIEAVGMCMSLENHFVIDPLPANRRPH